jgi:hypothetical protein
VQAETATLNNNRCPLCRQELFDQEDTEAAENALYESDELAYDNYDDEMGGEEGVMDEEAFQEAIDALLNDYESGTAHLAPSISKTLTEPDERAHGPGSSAPEIEEATNRRQEFREHAARRRNMGRTTVAKSPGRTRTYTQIEASDVETDADWSGSEYEPEDDSDPADEREEKRTYRLLPGEYGT